MADPVFLRLAHLYSRVPANVINGYFNDSGVSVITDEMQAVKDTLAAAEGELYSRMMRAYPRPTDLNDAIKQLVENDPVLLMHVAWIGCEMACERRPEFTSAEGWGAYKAQYDRAITFIENLSKGIIRSKGEAVAGANSQVGGASYPNPEDVVSPPFVFAASTKNPGGPGGF